jgi:hypothetical protein
MRTRALALLVVVALATEAPVLAAQQASPAAARAATGNLAIQGDSARPLRPVRPCPVVFGGALLGGGLGLAAGVAAGAVLGGAADQGEADTILSGEGIGAILGGALGYAVGAGVGAHFAASGKPRPNALATIGISVLSAAAAGLLIGGVESMGLNEATRYVAVVAVPVVHLAATAQFARLRARRR